MSTLAITLKKLREDKKMSQIELAKKAGIGSGTLGDIERGINKSTIKTINKIITALDLNLKEKDMLLSAFLGTKMSSQEKIEKLEEENKKLKEKYSQIDERVLGLDKKSFSQYEKTMNEASLFFQDENISDEDKQKMVMAISELFFESKQMNKEKYKKNKKDNNE